MLHVGQRLQQRPLEDVGQGGANRSIAVGGDDVVRGQRRRKPRTALAEHLEQHPERAALAVHFALEQSHPGQPPVRAGAGPPFAEGVGAALDRPADPGQPRVGGGEVGPRRRERQGLGPQTHPAGGEDGQPPGSGPEGQELDVQEPLRDRTAAHGRDPTSDRLNVAGC